MESLPAIPSLPERILHHLRAAIERGQWKEALPSERVLAAALQVSRPTLRLALARLKEEGWLRVEGTRTVLTPTSSARRRGAAGLSETPAGTVRLISPMGTEDMPASVLIACQELASRLALRGHQLRIMESRAFGSRNPGPALEQLLQREGRDGGWILFRAPLAVQQFFQNARVPCTLLGNPHPGITLPAVALDFAVVARHAANRLRQLGHHPQHIAVFISENKLAGNEDVLKGVADALGSAPFQIVCHREDGSNLAALTDNLLRPAGRPTALLVHRHATAISVASRALSFHRLKIPESLSIICLESTHSLSAFHPSIACYRHRYAPMGRSLADIIQSLMAGVHRPGQQLQLLPKMLRGESLAHPPR